MDTVCWGVRLRISIARALLALAPSILCCTASHAVFAQGVGGTDRVATATIPDSVALRAPEQHELTLADKAGLDLAHHRFQAAIEDFKKMPKKTSMDWNMMGIAYQQMFQLEQAKKSYETSLKLDSANSKVINNLGTVYYSQKKYSTAEHYYQKALKLEPKSTLIYRNLGTAYIAEKKFRKGWECFQQALKIDPNAFNPNDHFRVGDPTPVQTRGAMNYYLAKSYLQAGKLEEAVECLRKAIDEKFTDVKKVLADKELASLHNFPQFMQLLNEQHLQ